MPGKEQNHKAHSRQQAPASAKKSHKQNNGKFLVLKT